MHCNSIPELSLTYKVTQFHSSEVSQVKRETNIRGVIGKKNKSSHVGCNTPWVRHIQFIRFTTNNKIIIKKADLHKHFLCDLKNKILPG